MLLSGKKDKTHSFRYLGYHMRLDLDYGDHLRNLRGRFFSISRRIEASRMTNLQASFAYRELCHSVLDFGTKFYAFGYKVSNEFDKYIFRGLKNKSPICNRAICKPGLLTCCNILSYNYQMILSQIAENLTQLNSFRLLYSAHSRNLIHSLTTPPFTRTRLRKNDRFSVLHHRRKLGIRIRLKPNYNVDKPDAHLNQLEDLDSVSISKTFFYSL